MIVIAAFPCYILLMGMGTRRRIGFLLFAGTITAIAAGPASAIDCTCRFRGANYNLGDLVCLKTANGLELAQCQMVLNNTSWKFLSEQCPVGELRKSILDGIGQDPAFGPEKPPAGPRARTKS